MDHAFLLKTVTSFLAGGIWIGASTLLAERLGSKKGGLVTNLPSTILVALVFVALAKEGAQKKVPESHNFINRDIDLYEKII
jgi:hypothetical protein